MDAKRIEELLVLYRDGLLGDTVPWWQSRLLDQEHGGYLTYRDADGSLLSTDKPVRILGEVIWVWSRLYNKVERRPAWLEVAGHGVDFMLKHAFDSDGRMFFCLTKEGQPLRKRRYLFTEAFGVLALAEFARASGSEEILQRARELYRLILMYNRTPGLLPPKVIPQTRALRGYGMLMMLLGISQIMREADGDDPLYDDTITRALDELFRDFVRPEKRCVLETLLADGTMLDTPEGRMVNPGHAVLASNFIMEEARYRGDQSLVDRACQILEWSLDIGWDEEYGGIRYFVDCDGKPPEPYEHELKLWWSHNEALYGCLLAHHLTGDARWSDWYERLHDWAFRHFPDREHGEWFGYLRRDGSVSSPVKSNVWKGPFHIARMQLNAWKLLEEMKKREGTGT
jgi:N-acylglucosamine 2-epimerase